MLNISRDLFFSWCMVELDARSLWMGVDLLSRGKKWERNVVMVQTNMENYGNFIIKEGIMLASLLL